MSAIPSEIASQGLDTSLPGASTASPYFAAAAPKSADGLKWNFASTSIARTKAPASSSTAFTICTHVVASIPPNSTYAIIAAPTMMMAVSYERPNISLMSPPAPTIWAIR